jgi:hypothetical protein
MMSGRYGTTRSEGMIETTELDAKRNGPENARHWRGEVTTADTADYVDKWSTNALRFVDKDEALEYVHNLARRWMMVTRWRAVDESTPLDQPYEEGSEDGRW